MIHTRLAKLGNSHGFRVPRPLLEAAGIQDAVTIEVRNDEIVIRRELDPTDPRANWDEEFRQMAQRDAAAVESVLDFPNRFDQEDWQW